MLSLKKRHCAVTTAEQIASISTTDISGQSQKVDLSPLRISPSLCPVASAEYGAFEVVPASESKDKPAPMTNLLRAPSEPQITEPDPQVTNRMPQVAKAEPQARCPEMIIVHSNSYGSNERPYPQVIPKRWLRLTIIV